MRKHNKSRYLNFSRRHYWYFFAAFVISGLVGLYSLRQNNLTSIRLRAELLEVDKQNGDVEASLRRLREHIYAHMNASLSSDGGLQQPVQLKYRYERLLATEKERVSAANSRIYTEAQTICERQFPAGLSGSGRIPCIQDYVAKHGNSEQSIPDALYKFDFVAPLWSPDLAGWSLLVSFICFVIFVIGFTLDRRFRRRLHS